MPPVSSTKPASTQWRWNAQRVRVARSLVEHGIDSGRIADLLGCAPSTVEQQFPESRTGSKLANRREFTEREVEIVQTAAAYGIPNSTIAKMLRTTVEILERECGDAMEIAVANLNAMAAACLVKQMQMGSVPAITYFLKARGGPGWRETQHISMEGKVGVLVAPGGVEPDAWIEMEAVRTQDTDPTSGEPSAHPGAIAGAAAVRTFDQDRELGAVLPWRAEHDKDRPATPAWRPVPISDLGLPDPYGDDDPGLAAALRVEPGSAGTIVPGAGTLGDAEQRALEALARELGG